MRTVFAGTPEFAAHILAALIDRPEIELVAVYTQPDRPSGRGKKLTASPVKQLAEAQNIPVYQPRSLRDAEAVAELARLEPVLMIVAAYGLILPSAVLELPRHGCLNVHASLLPRWRGAAPIERAIEAGDTTTGVTIMQMDEGLDTGDMLTRAHCAIDDDDTGDSLRAKLTTLGVAALNESLDALMSGALIHEPQPAEGATYAHKLERAEAIIDWHQPAHILARRIRAFCPSNTCQTTVADQRLSVLSASVAGSAGSARPGEVLSADRKRILVACGDGALSLDRLQLAGGKPMDAAAMLNGRAALFSPGKLLGAGN